MVLCASHASHEQFTPSALLRYVGLAEQVGFTAVSSSEHLQLWSPRQGQSGFAWAWLGAAMQVTSGLKTWTPPFAFRLTCSDTSLGCSRTSL
jgi:coenzyme F420-dependent glucose-6-phosphate dehydrogenase